MRVNQIGKVIFKLFGFEFVRTAVKVISYPLDGPLE